MSMPDYIDVDAWLWTCMGALVAVAALYAALCVSREKCRSLEARLIQCSRGGDRLRLWRDVDRDESDDKEAGDAEV